MLRKVRRIMGARKANSPDSYLMPMSTEFQHKFYFHQHIMTVGAVSSLHQGSTARDRCCRHSCTTQWPTSERPIINEHVSRACKPRAKYLEPFSDSQLRTKASTAVEAIDLTDEYTLGTVSGCDMYASIHNAGQTP